MDDDIYLAQVLSAQIAFEEAQMRAIESQRAAETDAIRMRVAEALVRLANTARHNETSYGNWKYFGDLRLDSP